MGKTYNTISTYLKSKDICTNLWQWLKQHKGKSMLGVAFVVFIMLALGYIFDAGRMQTRRILVEKGKHTATDYMLSSLNVTAFAQDSKQLIWIGTSAGINIYDGNGFIQFFHDSNDTTALPDDYINTLMRDRQGRMWIGTQNGLARYLGGYHFKRYRVPSSNTNILWIEEEPGNGTIRVGNGRETFQVNDNDVMKLQQKDIDEEEIEHRKKDRIAKELAQYPDEILMKPRELASATFTDSDGNHWVGFRNAGYQILSKNVVDYEKANINALAKQTEGRDIIGIEALGNHLLAGTTLRLYTYNTTNNNINYTFYRQLFGEPQELHQIVGIDNHSFWLIGNTKVIRCAINGGETLSSNIVYSAEKGLLMGFGAKIKNRLYASCENGFLLSANANSQQLDSIRIESKWYDNETQLAATKNGKLLLFMKDMHIGLFDPTNNSLKEIKTHGVPDYGNIDPAFVRQDSRGIVWLGTKRYGLYRLDLKSGDIERMKFLNDVHIQGLTEDRNGRLWITTLKDAVCYNPATGEATMNSIVSSSKNQTKTQFFDNSIAVTQKGDVVLGCSDGCKFLPPLNDTKDGEQKPSLIVYSMTVNTSNDRQLTTLGQLKNDTRLTLASNENTFDFLYFHPNYSQTSSFIYEYKLDGFDNDWQEASYSHSAHYTNLPSGKYTFRIRLLSSPDLPPVEECSIVIRIKPSPGNSAAAWVLYAVCCALALYFINSLYLSIKENRLLLEQEKNERNREKQAKEMNMNFFANISHEFRNPITIIAGPLMQLAANESLPISVKKSLERICMSVNRMLRLIDQMLDFNQLETDALRLKVTKTNVKEELHRLANAFVESTDVRGITFEATCDDGLEEAWIDTDKFEKIMSNLFTNALKHTPDGGKISIQVRSERTGNGLSAVAEVRNSGSHIDEERMPDVFKRYYQLADAKGSHLYGWGTGIGLYYVKRLVGLHHGEISVENIMESAGGGVAFRFCLPCSKSAFSEEELCERATDVLQIKISHNESAEQAEGNSITKEHRKTKILIVDDDIDVAQYIRSLFSADYTVENRYSAEAALQDLADIAPDIILSDIIMGKMSGYEFCKQLKSDLMFSHIPVVLITAKSNIDEQIQGLRLGAVGYVTKPFDPEYLRAMVEAQLENISTLRRRLGESTETTALADTLSEEDRRFMDELYGFMEKRAAEMELSVSVICRDLLISQSKFNYKLKELTGDTPGVFFRKYKLNKAAQYLKEGKMNVSEIAIATGFATAAHFSVAFKKQFGVSPSEYNNAG